MSFYRQYEKTKTLLKNSEVEITASMIGDNPDLITIAPWIKANLNELVYPLIRENFPELKVKLWWRPATGEQVHAKVEIL